jgi:hypothetical protein
MIGSGRRADVNDVGDGFVSDAIATSETRQSTADHVALGVADEVDAAANALGAARGPFR